jgi:hypothetical protein
MFVFFTVDAVYKIPFDRYFGCSQLSRRNCQNPAGLRRKMFVLLKSDEVPRYTEKHFGP